MIQGFILGGSGLYFKIKIVYVTLNEDFNIVGHLHANVCNQLLVLVSPGEFGAAEV